jgi:hypothetical protein
VEPIAGAGYNWSEYDAILSAIGQRGLSTILVISGTPDWAAVDPGNLPSGPIRPEFLDEFAAFIDAAVRRYSIPPYNVQHWELFNEPDGTSPSYLGVIGTWGNYGAEYAQMLSVVYPAIKQADPGAKVLLGGLAYSNFLPSGPFNRAFLDHVLAAGGGAYFDVFNFHYYETQASEWSGFGLDLLGKVNYLRAKLAEYGLSGKPMIVSEAGAFGTDDQEGQEPQSQYVPKLYLRGLSANLMSVVWYSLNDEGHATVLMPNGEPRLAHKAFKVMQSNLVDARFERLLLPGEVGLTEGAGGAFEGYSLRKVGQQGRIWVAWMNSGTGHISIALPALAVIDVLGNRYSVAAGEDGRVHVPLGTSPLYMEMPG